jgi:hypothetical protein
MNYATHASHSLSNDCGVADVAEHDVDLRTLWVVEWRYIERPDLITARQQEAARSRRAAQRSLLIDLLMHRLEKHAAPVPFAYGDLCRG